VSFEIFLAVPYYFAFLAMSRADQEQRAGGDAVVGAAGRGVERRRRRWRGNRSGTALAVLSKPVGTARNFCWPSMPASLRRCWC